jgi:hypothetical protein
MRQMSSSSFVYLSNVSQTRDGRDFVLTVPSGIQSKTALLAHYDKHGGFPGYFGGNWDAFLDCLRDFSWVEQRKIVIVHHDLPLTDRPRDLRIYLEALGTAVSDWAQIGGGPFARAPNDMRYVEHELLVVFPSSVEDQISDVLCRI